MYHSKHYTTEEKILEMLRKQKGDSDDESDSDLDDGSETEDCIQENENAEDDIFDVDTDFEITKSSEEEHDIKFELGKDNETIWCDKPMISPYSKVPAKNLVTNLAGPKGEAKGVTKGSKIFSLFVTNDMINSIVLHTNREIEVLAQKFQSEPRYVSSTDATEINALLGLLYMSGVLKNSGLNTSDMFSSTFGPPLFRCAMSLNRFKFLLRALRFDDKTSRNRRRATDKFAPFRDLWNKFIENCAKYYDPSEYLTVDETLLSFRGRCPFRMYIPSKPDKYGLKIVSLCDARTFYFLNGIPYVGKETVKQRGDLLMPTQYVVRLTESVAGSSRNITCDNWFSSLELADELTKRKLTMVGTLRKNKPQIPPSMLTAKCPVPSTHFLYQPDKMIVSHTPKKNKKVLLISSMHTTGEINTETSKPEIIEFYNITKGGVDVLDKLCHDKTTKRATRRWPLRYFFGILDITAVNSFVLYKWNLDLERYTSQARTNFLKTLAFDLVEPLMKRRVYNQRIPKQLRSMIKILLNLDEEDAGPSQLEEPLQKMKRRCEFCERKKDKRGKFVCQICKKTLCGEHKEVICPECSKFKATED